MLLQSCLVPNCRWWVGVEQERQRSYDKRLPHGACIHLVLKKLVVRITVVVFVIVVFDMVVIVNAHCRNMHDVAPHGATAA